ncbi:hypothetical protein ACFWBM_36220 [Streptomyces sp. NPDC059980]|uniref:hypothetical protein n=1 Tax=Streptomyces sp. NPDC059980 TaxID=3347022 RepID=UPI0036C01415
MARSDTLRSEIAQLVKKNAGLHSDLAKAQKTANDAGAAVRKKNEQAARPRWVA